MEIKLVKTLRTLATHAQYEQHRNSPGFPKCYICEAEPIKEYRHWKIIENQFPYDEVAATSHMVVPKRHLRETELTWREVSDFEKVKADVHREYDMIIENTKRQKSIPGHYHLHLLKLKQRVMAIREKRPKAVFLTPDKATVGRAP